MEWKEISTYIMIVLLKKNYLFLIPKAMIAEFTTSLTIPRFTIPLSIIIAVTTMVPFAAHIEEWWYAPAWIIISIVAVYIFDLVMAIRLSGALNGVGWQFRSDKATIWFANLIGVLTTVGFLHIMPIAAKSILVSQHISEEAISLVYFSLMTTAWGVFIGICISNTASAMSNGARAGVFPKYIADYVIKRIDTYKSTVDKDG